MNKAMMSHDWKENYTALLAEVRQLPEATDAEGVRIHLEDNLDSFRPPDERDWCAMHVGGHCPVCGSYRCSGCIPAEQILGHPEEEFGPHTFSDTIDQSFKEEMSAAMGIQPRPSADTMLAALEAVELETTRAIRFVKGAHSSPETIRYLMMKIYHCNDIVVDLPEEPK